jgi:hypothetical protein
MPTFATPEPITATIELGVGYARITASDRTDTVVEVRPSDPMRQIDVRAAEQILVEYASGRLVVRAPKHWRQALLGPKPGSVDVTVELPAGSGVRGDLGAGAFQATGRLGECRFKTGAGDVELDHTGPLDLDTGAGTVVVERVSGRAEISTGTGQIRMGAVEGEAVVKNSAGSIRIGEVAGELRATTAAGDISIDRTGGPVTANTSLGSIRVGEIARGLVVLKTATGGIDAGIRAGTAALLDVHTGFGRVDNQLDAADRPATTDETAEVRARTSFGDITIRRAAKGES